MGPVVAPPRSWVLPLCLIVLAGTASATGSGFYHVDGVTYYMATGEMQGASATVGGAPLAFEGCGWAKMRPDNDHARIQVYGLAAGVPVEVDFTQFDDGRPDGGVAWNTTVSGAGARVPAAVAAWGAAQLYVGGTLYPDPTTRGELYNATFFVVGDEGDERMRLRLSPGPGGPAAPDTWSAARPAEGAPYFPPSESYREVFLIPNMRFGGNGTLDIQTDGLGLAQDNNLTFTLRAPGGAVVTRQYAAPSLAQSGPLHAEFPLDRFGNYVLEVEGRVSLSQYEVAFTQEAPSDFELAFQWDSVALGSAARQARNDCQDQVGSTSGEVAGSVVTQSEPPRYRWLPVVAAVVGGVAVVLAAIKLVAMTVAAVGHQRLAKR